MQTASFRYVVLITILLAGAGIGAVFGESQGSGTPRWPDAESLYTVDAWSTGPQAVQHNNTSSGNHTDLVTRLFRSPAGTSAIFTIITNQAPKLYGAGAEVPFLGSGYIIAPPSKDVAAIEGNGVSALVAQRGTEQWLVMYAYGERRGLLGNGPLPWTLALLDGIGGRQSDYYKLYLTARTDQLDGSAGRNLAELARVLFLRVAAWYAA